jgi:L,D-transpeptidase YcbB
MRTLFLICCVSIFSLKNGFCIAEGKNIVSQVPGIRLSEVIAPRSPESIDSAMVFSFFESYPKLAKYRKEVIATYRQYQFHPIWMDDKGVSEFGNSLYSKVRDLTSEGVISSFPYQDNIAGVFEEDIDNTMSYLDTELMLTCLFAFYTEKVYKGIEENIASSIGWYIPRKQLSYNTLLDSVLSDPYLLEKSENLILRQYYKLREILRRYRDIEKTGGWNPIDIDPKLKAYKPGDSAKAILQIRDRLFAEGYLAINSQSSKFDESLVAAVKKYQRNKGKKQVSAINQQLIHSLNVPVSERIKIIMINMERCRWISPGVVNEKELIFVNIPAFWLTFFRDGQIELKSPVVVGKTMTKTVIFSGDMSYIVFSPYWNLPRSIINKEVKSGMAKNPDYLESHNMEWNNGQVRQKPGKNNSLGLVKFIFPNSNDIYLHDTPSKSLFDRESRAFSHGCIRVGRPKDLAVSILKTDKSWTPAKIDAAMHAGKETTCTLKNKIPVYIGYFTAWVDEQGEINFYDDVYKLDERLAKIMKN